MKPIKPEGYQGKSGQDKPHQGKPHQGKPNQGKPNQGKPHQGKPGSSSTVSRVQGQAPSSTYYAPAGADKGKLEPNQQPKTEAPKVAGSVSGKGTLQSQEPKVSNKTDYPMENVSATQQDTESTSAIAADLPAHLKFETYRKEHEHKLVGRFVENADKDRFYVSYSYSDGLTHLVHGYGKRSPFVLADELITAVSTEKVALVLPRIFDSRYTYLTDGNCLFLLERFNFNFNLSVCAYANSVTQWFETKESVTMLYQLPHTMENDKGSVHVLLAVDEKPSHKFVLDTVKKFKLSSKPTKSIDVSDLEPIDDDFMADTFTVNFY